jgi:hypothetical protein
MGVPAMRVETADVIEAQLATNSIQEPGSALVEGLM